MTEIAKSIWGPKIAEIARRYAGRPDEWDVVCEKISAGYGGEAAAEVRRLLEQAAMPEWQRKLDVINDWSEWLPAAVALVIGGAAPADKVQAEADRWGAGGGAEFAGAVLAEEGRRFVEAAMEEPEAEAEPLPTPVSDSRALVVLPTRDIMLPQAEKRKVVLGSEAPCDIVDQFVADRFWFTKDEVATLLFWQEQFWRWDLRWRVVDAGTMRSMVYAYLNKAEVRTIVGGLCTKVAVYDPKSASVSNVIDALKSHVNLEPDVLMPAWLGMAVPQPVKELKELIPCANGLLDPRTGELFKHTPRFWSANLLEFDYNPKATAPRFMQYLEELWPGDPDAQQAVLEVIGICLTDETRYQKTWMIVGKPGSGRSTLGRVIQGILGSANAIGTTLKDFSEPFGLQHWIGKKVAIISDANLDGIEKRHMGTLIERIKNISGEDPVTVNRKFGSYWEGTLTARMIFIANEILAFRDDSNALRRRIITIELLRTVANVDRHLTEKLLAERSGILNLALAALRKVRERGEPLQPRSGLEMKEALNRLTSDIETFIDEECKAGPDEAVAAKDLFRVWLNWCRGRGISYGWGLPQFTAKLRAACPTPITESRPRINGKRHTVLRGIGLRKPG
jgi:P4 family phage/plasmid primase-like protien